MVTLQLSLQSSCICQLSPSDQVILWTLVIFWVVVCRWVSECQNGMGEIHPGVILCLSENRSSNKYALLLWSVESSGLSPVGFYQWQQGHHCYHQYHSPNLEHEFQLYPGNAEPLPSINIACLAGGLIMC